jgi:hypothetical protein
MNQYTYLIGTINFQEVVVMNIVLEVRELRFTFRLQKYVKFDSTASLIGGPGV